MAKKLLIHQIMVHLMLKEPISVAEIRQRILSLKAPDNETMASYYFLQELDFLKVNGYLLNEQGILTSTEKGRDTFGFLLSNKVVACNKLESKSKHELLEIFSLFTKLFDNCRTETVSINFETRKRCNFCKQFFDLERRGDEYVTIEHHTFECPSAFLDSISNDERKITEAESESLEKFL